MLIKQLMLTPVIYQMILTRASNLCNLVHIETSLLPKPVKKYRKLIGDLNELLNLWSGLRAIRQNIPRKLTVLDVMPQRTELVRRPWHYRAAPLLMSDLYFSDLLYFDHIACHQSFSAYPFSSSAVSTTPSPRSRTSNCSYRRSHR